MQDHNDILASLETQENEILETKNLTESKNEIAILEISEHSEDTFDSATLTIEETRTEDSKEKGKSLKKIKDSAVFLVKYMTTSLCIFGILMVASNYSAYWNLAYSVIYAEDMKQTKQSLIRSVAAAEITEEKPEEEQEIKDTFRELRKIEQEPKEIEKLHDISRYSLNSHDIDLDIEITPYENRIIIPKIGKNIPLIDIKQKKVEGVKELNNIFMDELKNGVVRYPGSALPGQKGNSFIFGHSSNNAWEQGEYNDVFALLDKVVFDDEVVVYYEQEKHTYKIRTKNVIRPGDVSILKNNEKSNRSQITLMTCWPIGTTLNRLVLTGDLIHVEK